MGPALQSGCGKAPVSIRKEDTPVNGLLEKLLTLPELRELAAEVHKTRCCADGTSYPTDVYRRRSLRDVEDAVPYRRLSTAYRVLTMAGRKYIPPRHLIS